MHVLEFEKGEVLGWVKKKRREKYMSSGHFARRSIMQFAVPSNTRHAFRYTCINTKKKSKLTENYKN